MDNPLYETEIDVKGSKCHVIDEMGNNKISEQAKMTSDQKFWTVIVPNANLYFFQRLHELQHVLLNDKIAIKPRVLFAWKNDLTSKKQPTKNRQPLLFTVLVPGTFTIYGPQNGDKALSYS